MIEYLAISAFIVFIGALVYGTIDVVNMSTSKR